MKTITSEKLPIQLWCDEIDEDTINQAKNLANLPFAHHHIAVMADAHVGYGMPIGGVAATGEVVIPNAVGVDIGCGVCASKSSITSAKELPLRKIVDEIKRRIPLGFKHHKKPQPISQMPLGEQVLKSQQLPIVAREFQKGRHQLGSLGGGNHFIEIQKGNDGHIWVMIHSGSRNVGYQVANHYNKIAKQYNVKHGSKVPVKWQLDYLPIRSKEGRNYLKEMEYCVKFARSSRYQMLKSVKTIMSQHLPQAEFTDEIDIAHNYAKEETHFGRSVVVHRKGATKVEKGELGIIPGSQGTASFIVRGLGNRDSFNSCSHGAGRKFGRKQAIRTLNLQQEIAKLNAEDILHAIKSKKDLDEAPGAYKDIYEVMAKQKDLVEVLVQLSPLAVVKG